MNNQEIVNTFNKLAEDFPEKSTEYLLELTRNECDLEDVSLVTDALIASGEWKERP